MARTKARDADAGQIVTALIYTRVSSDEQAREGVSLDAQLRECRQYVADRGWLLGHEYQDVLSGKRDDRPNYLALLAEVRRLRAEGQPVAVVVMRLDRFGRRVLERIRCREELKHLGVPTHSVREGGEVSDVLANVMAALAEEEVRQLGERVSGANRHIRANGWYHWGRPPWGYRHRPATEAERASGAGKNVLEENPETAPYVREAWARVARGESIRSVATWVAHLPEAARGGRRLRYSGVRAMLDAAVYVGRITDGNTEVLACPRGRWPALVDDATWEQVQARVASHQHMPHQATGAYLLTGLLRCPRCGCRMRGFRPKDHPRRYLCSAKYTGARVPDPHCTCQIPTKTLDDGLLGTITTLVQAVTTTEHLHAELERAWAALREPAGTATTLGDLQHFERIAEQARRRLTNAARLLVDGDIDRDQHDLLRDEERAALAAAEAEITRLRAQVRPSDDLPPLDFVLGQLGGWAAALGGADVPAQRDTLGLLIDHVVPQRMGRGKYELDIAWTPLGESLRQLAAAIQARAA